MELGERKRYTATFKAEAVALSDESGRTLTVAASELGVHVDQPRNWRDEILAAGSAGASARRRRTWLSPPRSRRVCTRARHGARHLKLQPRAEYGALRVARGRLATKEGRRVHARRAGIEGTLSQGVRAFGLRRSRYRGSARTHLQHVATAVAIDLARLSDWLRAIRRAATRGSRFAALAARQDFASSILRMAYPLSSCRPTSGRWRARG